MKSPIYAMNVRTLQGKEITLESYKGQVMLVANTASKCGLTYQYAGLEALYQKYKDRGLVILGFPCNQFANQEPGNSEAISQICHLNYGVTFPMFAKIEVNGEAAAPLFQYLRKELPGWFTNKVKWNFTKFLVDRSGIPVKRFAPTSKPEKLEKFIEQLLNQPMELE